jgi:hypothetical protein
MITDKLIFFSQGLEKSARGGADVWPELSTSTSSDGRETRRQGALFKNEVDFHVRYTVSVIVYCVPYRKGVGFLGKKCSGPLGSGSVFICYGSGSFHQQA